MSGAEDWPGGFADGPWQDKTPEHIERLSRMMRGDGEDGGIPSHIPDSWAATTPGGDDTFDRLGTRPAPELGKYLEGGYAPAHRVLVLSDIPRIIGGLKSSNFIVNNGEDTADTNPDEGLTIDLRRTMIDAQAIGDFVDFFHRAEKQADAQYGEALFSAQQLVAEARERGMEVGALLIPETVNMSANDYFHRLERLAQDLGIIVAINTEDHEEGFDQYEEFKHFYPPVGATPAQYWETREQEKRPPERTSVVEPPTHEEIEGALDQFWETRGQDESAFKEILRILARATPEALDETLNENHLYVLRELAHFSQDKREVSSSYARVIMAKLGDMPIFERLIHEAKEHIWQWDITRVAVPLGLYIRRDPNVGELISSMAEFAAKNRDDTSEGVPLNQLLGALFHSFSPSVGPYLARYLNAEQPAGHNPRQAHSARSATSEWMPKYVDVVSSLPESEERTAALDAIRDAALGMLDQDIDPRDNKQHLATLRRTAGDILIRMGVDDQQERMSKHMLWLYENQGSLVSSHRFEEQYIQYRKLYGDIPEISRHITIG